MLTLKNGVEIKYNEDFDIFFQLLLEKIVTESRKDAEKLFYENEDKESTFNDLFLKELMDNAIYISHQLFELSSKNRKFAEFVLSGFLFNSIIISMLKDEQSTEESDSENKDSIH